MANPFNNFLLGQIINVPQAIARHGFNLMALLDAAQRQGNRHFVFDDYRSISYKDLYIQSKATAAYLCKNYNITERSKIGIAGVNSIAFTIALFASSGLGADVYLINPKQKKDYFDDIITDHKLDLILADEEVFRIIDKNKAPCIPLSDSLQVHGKLISFRFKFRKSKITVLSSGSSGKPKAEKRTTSVSGYLFPLLQLIQKLPLKRMNSILISVPIFHGYGLAAFLLGIFMRKEIRLAGTFSTETASLTLHTHAIDCWVVVPLMLQKVVMANGLRDTSLKTIISGGDALPQSTVSFINDKTTIRLYNLFGTSETGICTLALPVDLRKNPETIGKTLMGIKTKIVDDNGLLLENSGKGALLVKSRWASTTRSGTYTATGDVVSKNREGYYFYWGRKDDMMIIGGENIYPVEIESVIYKFPEIIWVKVNSYDDSGFKRIAANLVVNNETFDINKFRKWLKEHLPSHMMPSSILIADLPPNSKLV